VKIACVPMTARLSAANELTLYRIFQEALRNVEKHAGAKNIAVNLTLPDMFVQLLIKDDGVGFDPEKPPVGRKGRGSLGLFGMRERVSHAGGTLELTSMQDGGTEIRVRIPLPQGPSLAPFAPASATRQSSSASATQRPPAGARAPS